MPTPLDEQELLQRSLTSRSFIARNLWRTLWKGKKGALEYWNERLRNEAATELGQHPAGLGIYGFFHTASGLGSAARGFSLALDTTDVPHASAGFPFYKPVADVLAFETKAAEELDYRGIMLCFNPDRFLYDGRFAELKNTAGRRWIAHWVWELPVLPSAWVPALVLVDEIWAPTSFVAETVAAATQKPVRLVPYALQANAFPRGEARSKLGLPQDALIFLTTFDFNSYPTRKNPEATIRAFRDAFPRERGGDEILVVKSHGGRNREHVRVIQEAGAADPRIRWIDEVYSPDDVQRLQSACDAFVSLHRSEGFGLNVAECMGLGKPTVATDFSGTADFLDATNGFPIRYAMRRVGKNEYPHGAGQWWAEPDHDDAVDALRMIRNDPSEATRRGAIAQAAIARQFSYDAVGRIMKAALTEAGIA